MRRFVGRLVSLAVVLTLAWVVGGRMLVDRWGREADRDWASLGTPMTSFAGHFPTHGRNESADKLEEVAARLGIGMVAPGTPGRPQPSAADAKAFEAARADLDSWLDAQLGNPTDRISAPPEKLAAFLSAQASGIRYLVAQLQAGEIPVWEQDLDRLSLAPVPFLRGHRSLDRLLCASALEAQRVGRGEEAIGTMDAAGRVGASLRERPEMSSRLTELALLEAESGALRKLEGVPERLYPSPDRDLRKAMLTSLQAEAWLLNAAPGRGGAPATALTIPARVWAFYEKPYAVLAAADYSRALARTAAALREQASCTFEPDAMQAVDERARQEIGRWNVTRLALPSMAAFWTAVDRTRFQQELTAKVLELKARKAASPDGTWPRQAPGIESSTCPGNRWTYVLRADGGAVLTASQSPSAKAPAVRYEGAPPASAKTRSSP